MSSESKHYVVTLSDKAKKTLKKIPKSDQKKLIRAAEKLSTNPFPPRHQKVKSRPLLSWYRIRVGDYRVLYEVQKQVLRILVVHIAQRGDVYVWLKNK